MQAGGKMCPLCSRKIVTAKEAVWCSHCRTAYHEHCLELQEFACLQCGSRLVPPNEAEQTEPKRAASEQRVGQAWLSPALEASAGLLLALASVWQATQASWAEAVYVDSGMVGAVLWLALIPGFLAAGAFLVVHADSRWRRYR